MMHAAVASTEAQEFDKAGPAAGVALKIYKDKGEVGMQASVMELLAQIHLVQLNGEQQSERVSDVRHAEGHAREGLRLAKEAVELCNKAGDKARYAGALHTLASAHLMNEAPREALYGAQDCQKLFEELGDKQGEACAIITQACCFVLMRKNEAAESYAKKGKDMATACGDERNAAVGDAVLACIESGGLGENQTRRAAFFASHPDAPYVKQCMELSAKLRDMGSNPATGKHITVLTRGVLSKVSCTAAPAGPNMLAQAQLGGVLQMYRNYMPRFKLGSLDMGSGCSMAEMDPSLAAACMPTGFSYRARASA